MRKLSILACALLLTSQVLLPASAVAIGIKDNPPSSSNGGSSGGSSGGGNDTYIPPPDSGNSDPLPPDPSPPPPPNPSPPPDYGDGDGGGEDPPPDYGDGDSGDGGGGSGSSGGGGTGTTSTEGEVKDATHEEGKSDSGGGVGVQKGGMNCTIDGDQITCDYDMYVENNMIINGTILQSVNNLNPEIHWTPDLEELKYLEERIISGYDPIPQKSLLLYGEEDPLKEYYEELPDEVEQEELTTPDNDQYFYHDKTLIDVGKLNSIFEFRPAKEIDAVYSGEFNLNKKTRSATIKDTRETRVLGADILVWDDGYDFVRNRYVYEEMQNGYITKAQAVNAIYKSFPETMMYKLNQVQYPLILKDGEEDGTDENGNKLVAVGNTPFVTTIPVTHAFINSNTYFTRTYVSRNLIDIYWEKAVNAGLVTLFEKNENIKLSEFVLLVADMLHMSGEEVLNEEEQNLLVAVYGKDLPYYLDSQYLEAVRYLVARGIVEPNMAFDELLATEDLTTILMRAIDKDSRLDFKKIDFEYSEELVAKGYYPTNTVMSDSPIENLRIITSTSTASHYDYFIKKIDWIENDTLKDVYSGDKEKQDNGKRNEVYTTFYQTDAQKFRRQVSTMYVPIAFGYLTYTNVPDSHYMGIVEEEGEEYFHFRVPVDIETMKFLGTAGDSDTVEEFSPVEDGYFNINTPGASDVPMRWEVELGGGIYEEPTGDPKEVVRLDSKPIPTTWSKTYVDSQRKKDAQKAENAIQELNNAGTEFKFNTTPVGLTQLLWKGKKLEDAPAEEFKDHGDGTYSIFVKGGDPYKELMKHLTYASNLPSEQVVPAYVKDGRYALVSLNWLKRNKIINDAVEVEKGKKWILYSNRDNILIDLENRRIVSGQVVTELMKTDESPLVVEDPFSKDVLIDYRAISGISSDYLVVKDVNGNITLSTDAKVLTASTSRKVFNLTGSAETVISAIEDAKDPAKFILTLEETYPYSNYLIYRSRKNNVRQDYLVVAKPAVDGADSKANKQLAKFTELGFSDNIDVDVWTIGDKVIDADKEAPKHADKVMFHPETQEYHYDIPRAPNNSGITDVFKAYMDKEGSEEYPLPFLAMSDKVIDMNINLMSTDEKDPLNLSLYPSNLQNKSFKNQFLGSKETKQLGEMKLSVNGITGLYYPYGTHTWKDLTDRSVIVYLGSIPVDMKVVEHNKVTEYIQVTPLTDPSFELAAVEKGDYDKDLFTEVFRGKTRSIYSYDLASQANLTGYSNLNNSNPFGALLEGVSNKYRNTYDFFKALKEDFFGTINDALTILILNLLLVVPRVMLVWFFLYLALSFAHGSRLMQLICEKTFDIYKLLSLGLSDVNRLHPQSVWISTFFGTVLSVALMQEGTFLEILAWLVEGILRLFR